jgi:hypothetical protein
MPSKVYLESLFFLCFLMALQLHTKLCSTSRFSRQNTKQTKKGTKTSKQTTKLERNLRCRLLASLLSPLFGMEKAKSAARCERSSVDSKYGQIGGEKKWPRMGLRHCSIGH